MRLRFAACLAAGLLAGAGTLAGCCISDRHASEISGHVQTLTRVHAEPAMRDAAHRLGAELLPVFPEEVYECDLAGSWVPRGADCVMWEPNDRGLIAVRDLHGTVRRALPIQVQDWLYARLARRGDDLILLVPKLTRREVDRRTICGCYVEMQVGAPVKPLVVFVVDGAPKTAVQEVEVPVTVETVGFKCGNYDV